MEAAPGPCQQVSVTSGCLVGGLAIGHSLAPVRGNCLPEAAPYGLGLHESSGSGVVPQGLAFHPKAGTNWGISFFVCVFLIILFIYLFLAVLGLRCCARAFSSCGERGPLFIAVRGPLTIAASRCRAQAPEAQAQ